MRVEVYHNTHEPHDGHVPFLTPACADCSFTRAYEYESDTAELEAIWTANQRINGDELPDRFGTRSLSIGDLFAVDGVLWRIEVVSFDRVGFDPRLN